MVQHQKDVYHNNDSVSPLWQVDGMYSALFKGDKKVWDDQKSKPYYTWLRVKILIDLGVGQMFVDYQWKKKFLSLKGI